MHLKKILQALKYSFPSLTGTGCFIHSEQVRCPPLSYISRVFLVCFLFFLSFFFLRQVHTDFES